MDLHDKKSTITTAAAAATAIATGDNNVVRKRPEIIARIDD